MRPYEQIALRTFDIDNRLHNLRTVYPFNNRSLAPTSKWVRDTVHAVHVYTNPHYLSAAIGSAFSVHLAFNYDLIPGKELELIQLIDGQTVQLPEDDDDREGLAHLGYHIPDHELLVHELHWWIQQRHTVAQVSVTTDHTGTSQRYMYAFIDTRVRIGVWTKVISRIAHPHRLEELMEDFRHVNQL